MDNLFLEQFKSNYSAKFLAEGFVYDDHSISEPQTFSGREFSVLTIPHSNGDVILIEEAKKDNPNRSRSYSLHFEFNTKDDDLKTTRMITYLDKIFDVNFKSLKSIHDNYIEAGLAIGLFVKTGDVMFKTHLLLSHFDTSIVNKKSTVVIDNVTYNPVVKKLIKRNKMNKVVLNCGIAQSFDKGRLSVNFDTMALFFDKQLHIIHPNGSDCILVRKPNMVDLDTLFPSLLYTYFYDYFKERIDTKFFNMDIDLNNISQELFDQYLDVTDMVKI